MVERSTMTGRRRPRIAVVWLLAALGGVAPSVAAQQPAPSPSAESRWQRFDPERRAELERRFESFRRLGPEQRAALEERAAGLRAEREALRQNLPPEERAHLDGLPPEERVEVLRHQHAQLARLRGERLRPQLPPQLIERLEAAPAPDRPRLLHEWRDDFRGRMVGRGLRRAGRDLGLPEDEVERLERQPSERQWESFRDLCGRGGDWSRPRWGHGPSPLPEAIAGDREWLGDLGRAAIPTIEEVQRHGHLPWREAREVLGESSRRRVLEQLAASGRLSAEELLALEALPAGDLLRALRPRPGGGGGRHRPPRDEPRH
jgi:hypothetical protein